jgi:hypothetical protein
MKSTVWLSTLYLATLLSGTALHAQAPSIIEPRVERREGPPLWVSAEAVADEEKIVDLDLIDSPSLSKHVAEQQGSLGDPSSIAKYRVDGEPVIASIPLTECKSMSTLIYDRGIGPSATLLDLADNSESILRGKIRSVHFGFAFGVPSSLLMVEISKVVKGTSPGSTLYIDYPVARFRIGPFYFCNAAEGFEPHVGDEVLLFDTTGPAGARDHALYAPRLDQLLFQGQEGILFVPPALKGGPGLEKAGNLDEVIAQLRSRADWP